MDLDSIMQGEIKSDEKRQEPFDFINMWDIKQKVTNAQTKQKNS